MLEISLFVAMLFGAGWSIVVLFQNLYFLSHAMQRQPSVPHTYNTIKRILFSVRKSDIIYTLLTFSLFGFFITFLFFFPPPQTALFATLPTLVVGGYCLLVHVCSYQYKNYKKMKNKRLVNLSTQR